MIARFLVSYPELALFLAISIGYAIGGVKIRGKISST
jgi:putative transport protein